MGFPFLLLYIYKCFFREKGDTLFKLNLDCCKASQHNNCETRESDHGYEGVYHWSILIVHFLSCVSVKLFFSGDAFFF
jgi:hypothetical protein